MTALCRRLAALSLLAATMAMSGGALFAQAMHPICVAKQHDCGKTPRLQACCCLDQGDRSDEATPAAGKTQIAQSVDDGTMVVNGTPLVPPTLFGHAPALTMPARSFPPDLITLFGTFLI